MLAKTLLPAKNFFRNKGGYPLTESIFFLKLVPKKLLVFSAGIETTLINPTGPKT